MRPLRAASFLVALAASASAQTEIATWVSPDGSSAPQLLPPVAADGALAAVRCLLQGNRVCLYDLGTGTQTRIVPALSDPALAGTSALAPDLDVDAGRVVAGAPADGTAGTDAGRARVFDGLTGFELLDVTAPDAQPGDHFGAAVALDQNVLLVGAPGSDDLGVDAGSAYLVDATTGALLVELFASNAQAGARFGAAVALEGDHAVVGSPNFGAGNKGTVYVFDVPTGVQTDKLLPSDSIAGIRFGFSLAIHADRVAIGAPGTGNTPFNVGAYLFDLATGDELYKLLPSGPQPRDFGHAVALDATRVLVGDPGEHIGNPDMGATYVYDSATGAEVSRIPGGARFGEGLATVAGQALATSGLATPPSAVFGTVHTIDAIAGVQTGALATLNGADHDEFGTRLAIDGDRAIVVSPNDDADGKNTGSVYVLDVPSGDLIVTLVNPDPGPNGNGFGADVAIEGDHAVVGIPSADDPVLSAGSVAVYDTETGALVHRWTKPTPIGIGSPSFGAAVAIHAGRVLAGAPGAEDTGAIEGAAFLFDVTTGGLLHTLLPPPLSVWYGTSVALDGPWAVVASPVTNLAAGGSTYGAVFVYDVATGALVSTFRPSNPGLGGFASHVEIAGNRVLASNPQKNNPMAGNGSAWIFDAATGNELWELAPPPSPLSTYYGASLAIRDDLAFVGAPLDGALGNGGTVHAFDVTTGQPAFLVSATGPSVFFGEDMAVTGPVLVAGAPKSSPSGPSSGSVHVFDVPETPVAIPYCVPKTSTAGCQAAIAASGPGPAPVSGQADWSVSCTGVQGLRTGLLIGGLSGPATLPFAGGTLCVFPPQKRGPTSSSGGTFGACDGAFTLVVNDVGFPLGFDAGPGQTAWFQWWYRDPPSPGGPVALSDALEVPFL